MHVKVGGSWKTVSNVYVKVGGVWKEASLHTKVAGEWKQIHGGEMKTLSGTSGSPNPDNSASQNYAAAGWTFKTTGTVWKYSSATQFQDGIEWTSGQDSPTEDSWIRATVTAGSTPNGPVGSWLKVAGSGSADRTWTIDRDSTEGSGTTTCTLKIELATDSGGSNIVATGYYRANATIVSHQ